MAAPGKTPRLRWQGPSAPPADRRALDELFSATYEELRRLAASVRRDEIRDHAESHRAGQRGLAQAGRLPRGGADLAAALQAHRRARHAPGAGRGGAPAPGAQARRPRRGVRDLRRVARATARPGPTTWSASTRRSRRWPASTRARRRWSRAASSAGSTSPRPPSCSTSPRPRCCATGARRRPGSRTSCARALDAADADGPRRAGSGSRSCSTRRPICRRPSAAPSSPRAARTTRRLVDEVLALLDEDARGDSLLDRDLAAVASRAAGGGRRRARTRATSAPTACARCSARAAWASSTSPSAPTSAAWSRSRSCATPGCRRRGASASPASSARWPSSTTRPSRGSTTPTRCPTARRGSRWSTSTACRSPRYCAEQGCSIRRTLELFRAVCEAVQHAHRHAVIHRDLKPSNILVTRGGQPQAARLRHRQAARGSRHPADRTRTELRLMTPAYAAPEQIRGERAGRSHRRLRAGRHALRAAGRAAAVRPRGPHAGEAERDRRAAARAAASSASPRSHAARRARARPGPTSTCSASPRCRRTRRGATAPSKR